MKRNILRFQISCFSCNCSSPLCGKSAVASVCYFHPLSPCLFQKYDSKMAEVGGAWSWNRCYSLMVMTVAYIVGEVAHFLINTTGRAVAREIHFGDSACFPANNKTKLATNCTAVEKADCEAQGCSWDYSGLGLEYQVPA